MSTKALSLNFTILYRCLFILLFCIIYSLYILVIAPLLLSRVDPPVLLREEDSLHSSTLAYQVTSGLTHPLSPWPRETALSGESPQNCRQQSPCQSELPLPSLGYPHDDRDTVCYICAGPVHAWSLVGAPVSTGPPGPWMALVVLW